MICEASGEECKFATKNAFGPVCELGGFEGHEYYRDQFEMCPWPKRRDELLNKGE